MSEENTQAERPDVTLDAAHVTESDVSPPRGVPFPIVGIGASAGGLEAFGQLLRGLPPDTGMAFVLVQHLDPQHESLLTELLTNATAMPLVTIQDGMEVQPDRVYVLPPNRTVVVDDGRFTLKARPPGLHLPVDIFFESLASMQGGRAIGVVLSGNASDGSQGLRAIKGECGITFAQDEITALFGGMPRNAVATGVVDFVLPPADIGRELGLLSKNPFLFPPVETQPQSEELPDGDGDLKRILRMLHAATRVDFSHYKINTVRRRISRRMMVVRAESLHDYLRYIEGHPAEIRELYKDLLISVTSFFRDPESFEGLAKLLHAVLRERDSHSEPFRVWVPGCATGEEVYSLAICLYEVLQEQRLPGDFQIFGTDISDVALQRARSACYPESIAQDVSPERLRRFFSKAESGYQVTKNLRESCIFARHDLTTDPPFANMHLVSCRNLLIYMDVALQRRVLPVLHYALKPNGLLLLGSAETTAAATDLFAPADKQRHIYVRQPAAVRIAHDFARTAGGNIEPGAAPRHGISSTADLQKKVDRLIQTKYSPDGVLVDADLQILQFRGHTSRYLDPAPGEATLNLLRMARESLVLPLRRAVHSASERKIAVRERGLLVAEEEHAPVEIEVTPVSGNSPGENYFLVVFDPLTPEGQSKPASPADADDLQRMQRELTETREYLRAVREDYEAHAEELLATSEEARSANEELQSTNEELSTTKEELQSANEELTTVNDELKNRNQELNAINSDLKNLLAAVSLPIVMVDEELRLRRFNPAAEKMLELGAVDIGRPVRHLSGRIETPHLADKVRGVVESLKIYEEEIQDHDGRWLLLAIRPYRTVDHRIAGAVLTFQDIDPLKRSLTAAEEARDYAEAMIETVREPLIVLDGDLRVVRATPAFYETFLVSREETEGRLFHDLGNGQWNQPRLRELLGQALFQDRPFVDFELEHEFPHIGRRTMRLNARRIPKSDGRRVLLLAVEDVTERREIAQIKFQRLFESAKDGIVVIDAETEIILDVNPYFLSLTGCERHEIVGRRPAEAAGLRGMPEALHAVARAKERELVRYDDTVVTCNDGRPVRVEVVGNLYHVGSQPVVQLNIRDVAARREAENALRESEERFRLFVESVRDYALFQLNIDGKIVSWNTGAERLLGWSDAEIVGADSSTVFTPEDVAAGEHLKELETARASGRAEDERWHMRKDGSRFFASGVLTSVCDENGQLRGFAKIMRDVTERKAQAERLERSVEEKTILLREIHHRVKNNLQVIVSLLSVQANHSNDPVVISAFEETESRVRAIARIHERLYASDDLSEVEFGAYLTQLVRELLSLHGGQQTQIEMDLQVADMVLSIEQAIPLGLIANELILNSLKHGLRRPNGRLTVRLYYDPTGIRPETGETLDDGWARLSVEDNGPGLPPGVDVHGDVPSMGLRLVNLLLRQLHGTLEVQRAPGAHLTVSFPLRGR